MRRAFLAYASMYRGANGGTADADYSRAALEAAYDYESRGIDPDGSLRAISSGIFNASGVVNGYVYGKRLLNITIAQVKADIEAGLFCMADFCDGKSGWFWRRALRNARPCPDGMEAYWSERARKERNK